MRQSLSLDIGRAISAGQELQSAAGQSSAYSPAKLSLEQLKIGQLDKRDAGRRRAISTASAPTGKVRR